MKLNDIVVIGAGVIGLCTARELARRGCHVTVVDRQRVGHGASRAAGGIISALRPWRASPGVDEIITLSRALYPDFVGELEADTGIDPEYIRCGMVVSGAQHIGPATKWAAKRGVTWQELDPSVLDAPIRAIIAADSGILLEDICQVRNPLLLQALEADIVRRGVRVHTGVEVLGVATKGDRLRGIRTANGEISAGEAVICAGAWSSMIAGTTPGVPAVRPMRGQMIWYQGPAVPGLPIVDDGEHYAVRRKDGVTLVGSTVEDVGFDLSITTNALKILKNKAPYLMRDLRGCEVKGQWAGLRPASTHDTPFIGAHPTVSGLYLNTAHFRTGVTLAPASALILADLMTQNSTGKGAWKRRAQPSYSRFLL